MAPKSARAKVDAIERIRNTEYGLNAQSRRPTHLGKKRPEVHHQRLSWERNSPRTVPFYRPNSVREANPFFPKLTRGISAPRFASYAAKGGGEISALERYLWNTALCEALYPTFQILEVSFRNTVHAEIAAFAGNEWLKTGAPFLAAQERESIAAAQESLTARGRTITEPYLVAELSFGFWTSLLDVRYDKIWHKIIKGVFPDMPRAIRTRSEISPRMNIVRKLRNAAVHHHSIWHWADLAAQHRDAHVLIGWICGASARIASAMDRFPTIHSAGPDGFSTMCKGIVG